MNLWGKWGVGVALLLGVITGCQSSPNPKPIATNTPPQKLEAFLTLNNATLEQANPQGQVLWKISVGKAIYSKDKKNAHLEKVTGNLFQDGQLILKVSAVKGKIVNDGDSILLEEIVANDPRNGLDIWGKELVWYPKNDTVIIQQPKSQHAQIKATAKEGKYFPRSQRMELENDIEAHTVKQPLKLKTSFLTWDIPNQRVKTDKPVELVRFQGQTITDQVNANSVEVFLKEDQALLQKNVQFKSLQPTLQIVTESLTWNYQQRTLRTSVPINAYDYEQKINVSANNGSVDLKEQIGTFRGGVQGKSPTNQSQLYADEVVWKIPSRRMSATGNVSYEQTNPPLHLKGIKAEGDLAKSNVLVFGEQPQGVVTKIMP